jgi:hypothetical protein
VRRLRKFPLFQFSVVRSHVLSIVNCVNASPEWNDVGTLVKEGD